MQRLQIDYIDRVQHHEIIRYDDADRIFHEDGAQTALEDARQAGKLRSIALSLLGSFQPLSPEEMDGLRAQSRGQAERGTFELVKTSSMFDATAEHPEPS